MITHPIQAPQVLHFMLISSIIIVDNCMLFVHTTGLKIHNSS